MLTVIKAPYSVRETATTFDGKFYQIKLFGSDVSMLDWLTEQRTTSPKFVNASDARRGDWWLHERYFSMFVLKFGAGYVDD